MPFPDKVSVIIEQFPDVNENIVFVGNDQQCGVSKSAMKINADFFQQNQGSAFVSIVNYSVYSLYLINRDGQRVLAKFWLELDIQNLFLDSSGVCDRDWKYLFFRVPNWSSKSSSTDLVRFSILFNSKCNELIHNKASSIRYNQNFVSRRIP